MTKPASNPSRPADAQAAIDQAAADWIARRNGRLSPGEEAEFDRWLSADPRHAAAFAEFQGTWAAIKNPLHAETVGRQLRARGRRRTRRRLMGAAAGAGVAAAIAFIFVLARPYLASDRFSRTVVLQPEVQTLPDGSTVELDAGAQIAVAFTPEKRGVRLLRGDAFFTVAKDKIHPFVVTTDGIEVRAVGTAFSVHSEPAQVDVVVTEGTVAVEHAATDPAFNAPAPVGAGPIYVSAGKAAAVSVPPSSLAPLNFTPLTVPQAAAELSWRGQRFEFAGTPLSSAIQLFNRQNRMQLSIADAQTGARRVTGIFRADDPEGFVRLLEKGLNVKAERANDSIIVGSQ